MRGPVVSLIYIINTVNIEGKRAPRHLLEYAAGRMSFLTRVRYESDVFSGRDNNARVIVLLITPRSHRVSFENIITINQGTGEDFTHAEGKS